MTYARERTALLADLLRREHAALADFLLALADFDHRKLWMDLGHSSLFSFLHRELGLSRGAAHYRKTAAELVRNYPEVVEPLRDGRLCITGIVELAKVITPENRGDVLPRFFHRSKQEAKAVSASLVPETAPPRREVVTVVARSSGDVARVAGVEPTRPMASVQRHPGATEATAIDVPTLAVAAAAAGAAEAPGALPAPAPAAPAAATPPLHGSAADSEPAPGGRPNDTVQPVEPADANSRRTPQHPGAIAEPLTADLRRLHVTVSRRFLEKLEAARAALSHACPGASAEEILDAGLDLLLERFAKRKGLVANPRRNPPPSTSGRVPAHVSRAVWTRDGGRCQWPLDEGGVCGSTLRAEIDHVVPRAQGGPPTIDNLRVLCRFHNDVAARLAFGDAWMDRFTRGAGARGRPAQERGPSGPRARARPLQGR